jgi:hypothetical protein
MRGLLSKPNFSFDIASASHLMLRRLLLSVLLIMVASVKVNAEEYQTKIKNAEIGLENDLFLLSAEIEFALSPAAKDALLKGIQLAWDIPIRIKQKRSIWWNKEISSLTLRYQIRYYALMNIYRVKSEHSNQINNFSSLSAAVNSFSLLKNIPLIRRSELSSESDYFVELQANFDRNKLPIPLRPLTFFDHEWDLSSNLFACSIPK